MIENSLTPNENDVNSRNEQVTKVLDQLKALAAGSEKVKTYLTFRDTGSEETSAQASIKFYNGEIKPVDVTEDDHKRFAAWMKRQGWKLTPQLTSEGFICKPPAKVADQNALLGWSLNDRSIEDMLG